MLHEYTYGTANRRTGGVQLSPRTTNDGSTLEAGRRHTTIQQVGIDRVVDARVGPHVGGVTVTVERDEMPVLELGGKGLRPPVRRGGVARGSHDHDRAAAGRL